jgi:hypothetical protein
LQYHDITPFTAPACTMQGINMTALREIKILREIDNPFVVRLLDIFPHKRNLSLVSAKILILQSLALRHYHEPCIHRGSVPMAC